MADLLSREAVQELAEHISENSLSIYLPTVKAGREVRQNPIRYRNLLKQAHDRLLADGLRVPDVEAFLKPAEDLQLDSGYWQRLAEGLAIFIAPGFFRAYRLPLPFEEGLAIHNRFDLKPIMPLLQNDGRFYVLAVSQNSVRLLECTRFTLNEVEVEEMPTSLEDALGPQEGERGVQTFPATARGRRGQRHAIFFGHGVGDEDSKDDIELYFHRLDAGLREVLHDKNDLLVLAGVDYLHPIYAAANTYPHLMSEGIEANPDRIRAEELHAQAWKIVAPEFKKQQDEDINRYMTLMNTGNTSDHLPEILPAARHGQVEVLFVSTDLQICGSFDPASDQVNLEEAGSTIDLQGLAVAYTFLNNGRVYALPADKMPAGAAMAAIYRYAYDRPDIH